MWKMKLAKLAGTSPTVRRDGTLCEPVARFEMATPEEQHGRVARPSQRTPRVPAPAAPPAPRRLLAARASTSEIEELAWATKSLEVAGVDLTQLLQPCTIFAPSAEAIRAFAETAGPTAVDMLSTAAGLKAIQAHIIPKQVLRSSQMPSEATPYTSAAGTIITISFKEMPVVSSNGHTAHVVMADIPAGQAVVHVIDSILPMG
ncbi:hypothetical protein TSOC_001786 [Tetrabaena socialis]|uniref:FAS1 domain-containing protein n=1 Tax=Tetrabaena socialis TaxID=47790 RepID=A0A2J8AFV9_9CHLO|nr:hypothetical protein TSOC_001786 [Tetrabaena socialis]|eukprot:PNH11405.1 hypothetical protein TSOC_001786 [Tetrabaena socialis]